MKLKKLAALLAVAGLSTPVFATNGMNMEGYGPVASAMGGASMAYDNGVAATMNNPATLALMANGTSRLDVALGGLFPKATASVPGSSIDSGGTAYWMPAVGYVVKSNNWSYGVGLFAQGGMGTEYGPNTFMAAGSGQATRSELGVGRIIFPVAYQASPDFTVGGSIDYVWATLDMKFAASPAQLGGMYTGGTGAYTPAGIAGLVGGATWARIDFSDQNAFSGAAKGSGWAGKLGFTWKATEALTIGAAYHSKTSLSDLETSSQGAKLSADVPFADVGKLKVRNFQWPETYAVGVSYVASPQWQVVADVKHIGWAGVMQNFKMTFEGAFGTVNFAMPQNWKNQTVLQLGAAYKYSDALTVRFGGNFANNPIPDQFLNPLFPAIMKDHYTFGLGYALSKDSTLDFDYVYAPKVTATNGTTGITSSLGGQSAQLMYSQRF